MLETKRYVALLRGINVGGHHKVPMAELKDNFEKMNFRNVKTLLNSGNVVFESAPQPEDTLEQKLSSELKDTFGFPIPVIVNTGESIQEIVGADPFSGIEVTKDTRLYVSFLKEKPQRKLDLPWLSDDKTYQILEVRGRIICSVLDLSTTRTPKGMDALEQLFGRNITTRNWNTVLKICALL